MSGEEFETFLRFISSAFPHEVAKFQWLRDISRSTKWQI